MSEKCCRLNRSTQHFKASRVAAKARGTILGNPNLADVRRQAVASNRANADRFAKNVAPIIREGIASRRAIARALNARGVATARGGRWTAVQVGSILQRAWSTYDCWRMSAFARITDSRQTFRHVRDVPILLQKSVERGLEA
jgi:recombinase